MSTTGSDPEVSKNVLSDEPRRPVSPDTPSSEKRFQFGKNWAKFLELLDDDRMRMARESLRSMLGLENLKGMSFLDAGSGSGLFSLAAIQLDADSVYSFDYDEHSVGCTRYLRERYGSKRCDWTIGRGDCLDQGFIHELPEFDVVYSWGVLHHTGDMWSAMDNVCSRVKRGGIFFLSIYNDQRWQSRVWRRIKRFYCQGPVRRALTISVFIPVLVLLGLVRDLLDGRNPIWRYRRHHARGMSTIRDWFDWLGGYPFEVARPEAVLEFCRSRGFTLEKMRTVTGWGCNEFVFRRSEA